MEPIANPFDYELLRFIRANPHEHAATVARRMGRNRRYVDTRLSLLVEAGYLHERRESPGLPRLEVNRAVADAMTEK